MDELLIKLRFLFPTLSHAEKEIAKILMEKPEVLCESTLAELSRETGTSDATIVRFCRKLGYSGFTEMKKAFQEVVEKNNSIIDMENVYEEDSVLENLQKVYESNMKTLSDTIHLAKAAEYEQAAQLLTGAKSIHFFAGGGDAVAICKLFYFKFSRLGVRSSAHEDEVMQMVEAGNMEAGDVVLVISYEGRARTVYNAAKAAKENGASIICITKMSKSPLARLADICLSIATNDVTVGRDIIARRVAEQMIVDALYLSFLVRTGKSKIEKMKRTTKLLDTNKILEKGKIRKNEVKRKEI